MTSLNCRNWIFLLVLFFSTFFYGGLTAIAQQEKITLASPIGGAVGGYLLHLPDDYASNPTKKYPLMIFLHGLSETGSGSQTDLELVKKNGPPNQISKGTFPSSFLVNGETFKYIVISPQFNRRIPTPTPEELQAFLDYILPLYHIDRGRIYLTGISSGGGLIWNYCGLTTANAASIAGVVIMAGASVVTPERAANIASQNLPVWAFHNTGDPTVPVSYSMNYVDSINHYIPTPSPLAKLTLFVSNSHGVWYKGYDLNTREDGKNVYEWMLQYKRLPSGTNLVPVANAGTNASITLPVSSAALDGTASSDPDGSIVSYLWSQLSGPVTGTIANNTAASTSVSGLTAAGTYTFQLTVTDNAGATASANKTITVNPAANLVPVANAGTNASITLPVSSAALDGTASSDPDGSIVSYLWSQLSGPVTGTIANNTAASTSVSGLTTAGTYTFQLTVTDNAGATASANKTITVIPAANLVPVANAGTNASITLPVSSTTLDGTGSSDPDGIIVSYLWTQLSGPVTGTITSNTAANTSVSGLTTVGTYTFQLTVTDNAGASASANKTITVIPAANLVPVANAGTNSSITLPVSSATLDGTGSSDPDGSIVSYLWTQLNGPVTATITSDTAASASVSGLTAAGTYTFQLTVTDNAGASASANKTITVIQASNLVPVANAGTNASITLPVSSAALDGTASSDPDGSIVSYLWSQLSGPVTGTIASNTAASTSVSGLTTAGTYTFQLTVTDNAGASASANKTITVNPAANLVPVANAGTNSSITLPVSSAALDGTASSDPDGSIVSYLWSQLSGPVTGTIASNTAASTSVSGLTTAGTYTFQLTVTDNAGASASASKTITVNPAANLVPVANAGTNASITLPASSAALDGTASSDPDGSIVSYLWSQLSGPVTGTIASNTAASTSVSGLTTAGTYTFQLTVTDNAGASASASKTITVNPAAGGNLLPVANAGADQSFSLPQSTTTLNGSASFDPDGKINKYTWTKLSGPSVFLYDAWKAIARIEQITKAGDYIFLLKVTDNLGAIGTDTVKVSVTTGGTSNMLPVANAGANVSITLPDSLAALDGTASSDPDGSIVSYHWSQLSGPVTGIIVNNSAASTVVHALNAVGTYIFQLTVTDNAGASASANKTITVNAASNLVPVANAGTNASITLPASSAALDGTGSSDPDGSIVSYLWSQLSGPVTGTIASNTAASTSVSGLTTAGTYTFQLTVTDNAGASASANKTITVNPAAGGNQLPVANAGADQNFSLPQSTTTLNGSASFDPDGKINKYTWTKLSGPSVFLYDAWKAIARIEQITRAGDYVFLLKVTDNLGAIGTDTVKVTVQAAISGARSMSELPKDAPVSLLRGESKNELLPMIFPNPVNTKASLLLRDNRMGTGSITIYSSIGIKLIEQHFLKDQYQHLTELHTNALSAGMYYLKIEIGNREPRVIRFIKQ